MVKEKQTKQLMCLWHEVVNHWNYSNSTFKSYRWTPDPFQVSGPAGGGWQRRQCTMLCFLLLYSKSLWYLGTSKRNAMVGDNYGPVCSVGNRRSWSSISGFVSFLLNKWFWRDLERLRERLVGDLSGICHSFYETDSEVFYWQIISAIFLCEE